MSPKRKKSKRYIPTPVCFPRTAQTAAKQTNPTPRLLTTSPSYKKTHIIQILAPRASKTNKTTPRNNHPLHHAKLETHLSTRGYPRTSWLNTNRLRLCILTNEGYPNTENPTELSRFPADGLRGIRFLDGDLGGRGGGGDGGVAALDIRID